MNERRAVRIDAATAQAQSRASDPQNSAWVSANAGSGKTFVLSRRVVRLLLSGVEPGRILCLTFTKAAAAEMANRIFETLGNWVMLADAELDRQLRDLTADEPSAELKSRARSLFAHALDTPGGLKIQTIHAFCEALLHQFPLEANVPGHFSVADDAIRANLLETSKRDVFREVANGTAPSEVAAAVHRLAIAATDKTIDETLNLILGSAEAFREWYDRNRELPLADLWVRLGLDPAEDEEALARRLLAAMEQDKRGFVTLAEAAARSTRRDHEFSQRVHRFFAETAPVAKLRAFAAIFLTKDLEPRSALLTKPLAKKLPALNETLLGLAEPARGAIASLADWRLLRDSQALFAVARTILERYAARKAAASLVDYADLIERARNLLTKTGVSQWVQYKLDQGIDHVLVDEAQDTSPSQWAIIRALTTDFFAGLGASDKTRTVFAVGDEKQSIFSFQGAVPGRFAAERVDYAKQVRDGGRHFQDVSLHLSFRSVPDILAAVDVVFANPANFAGLSETEAKTLHGASRERDPGEVRIWPILAPGEREEPEDWLAPIDVLAQADPKMRLARRIAATIDEWLSGGERLPGMDRPLRPADILVLVRKRDSFMTALIRELKSRGLAIAGADRLVLTEHVSVEDLLALGRFVLQPADDLSLAALLKSPLVGIDDAALTTLAGDRRDIGLFDHLCRLTEMSGQTQELAKRILARLRPWMQAAASGDAFSFFASVLGRDRARKAFAERLGAEAEDVLDMFEELALAGGQSSGSGLREFIAMLERAPPEIKRDVDTRRDEIRVITVHSAKGLEAPVVFLVDPGSPATHPSHRPTVLQVGEDAGARPFLWRKKNSDSAGLIDAEIDKWQQAQDGEYRRLLYVAMTRAADRLIVCGYRGKRETAHAHWHKMVFEALAGDAEAVVAEDGGIAEWIWRSPRHRRDDPRPSPDMAEKQQPEAVEVDAPAWLFVPARREIAPPRPLSPSEASRLLERGSAARGTRNAAPFAAARDRRRQARERGIAIHRLLQFLPGLAADQRTEHGARWLQRQFPRWGDALRSEILAEAGAVLADPALQLVFSPAGRAEVRIGGQIEIAGRKMSVSGQIDRLAMTADAVEFAEFKSGGDADFDTLEGERLQLALYGALLGRIHPGLALRGVLVRTRTGEIEVLDKAAIDRKIAAITVD